MAKQDSTGPPDAAGDTCADLIELQTAIGSYRRALEANRDAAGHAAAKLARERKHEQAAWSVATRDDLGFALWLLRLHLGEVEPPPGEAPGAST